MNDSTGGQVPGNVPQSADNAERSTADSVSIVASPFCARHLLLNKQQLSSLGSVEKDFYIQRSCLSAES